MKNNTKKLIVIAGPTASGKTALSIELAKKLNCVVISADSRQFFKEMSIGTAKPSLEEQQNITHYFIDSHSITEEYTSGQFEHDALKIIEKEFKKNDFVIMVGGSGLYIDAVCKGIDDLPRNLTVRNELNELFEEKGLSFLQAELKVKDPDYYESCETQNPHRVIRALEVIRISNKTMSHFQKNEAKKRPFEIQYFSIEHDREKLYERINQRVVEMLENGLVDEVKSLAEFRNKQALKTVGYKEVFQYLDKEINYDEMLAAIQQNTRRYAKRQMTWFKREPKMVYLKYDNLDKMISEVMIALNLENYD